MSAGGIRFRQEYVVRVYDGDTYLGAILQGEGPYQWEADVHLMNALDLWGRMTLWHTSQAAMDAVEAVYAERRHP